MKKKNIKIIIPIIILIVLISCFLFINKPNNSVKEKESIPINEDPISLMMDNMTLDEKVAQMLVIYYLNDTVDERLIKALESHSFGGIVLSKENITTYDKTKKFVSDLQSHSKIPLIISIDEEGGSVQRLKYLKDVKPTDIPYMYYLGKTNNKDLAYQVGKLTAEELRTIGVNVAYAPVIDIYSNPHNKVIGKRSFSEKESIVSSMSISLAKGLEDNGVIATYKHFPGHGDTKVDSHYDLPIINKTYDELKELELKPFMNAINNDAKIIMTGHIALPNIIKNNTPASLSKEIITDILRKDMGYNGLVITDALNMGALTDNYTYEEIYTKAINAGVDLLLMPKNNEQAINYIKNNIREERIDESVKRILTFKYKYLKDYKMLDKSFLGNEEHKNIISKIKVDN